MITDSILTWLSRDYQAKFLTYPEQMQYPIDMAATAAIARSLARAPLVDTAAVVAAATRAVDKADTAEGIETRSAVVAHKGDRMVNQAEAPRLPAPVPFPTAPLMRQQ